MKRLPLVSIIVLSLFVALVSCDQNPVVVERTPTIMGSVSIPAGANVSGSDFFIRIMEGDKVVHTGKVSNDGSFKVSGLEEGRSYSILLTTEEPGDVGSKSASKAASSSGYGGWLNDVTASMNEQAGVGSVKVKPLGTIKGVVRKDGAQDGYDTTAYIPGTSFLAMTDADGSFSIYNVPQSAKPYTIRFTSSGYMPRMVDGIVLYSDDDTVNPVANVPGAVTLVKNAGNLVWTITKTGTSDHSGTTVMLTDGTNSYTGSTSNDGSLLISGIEPGTYNATITSSGFVTKTMDGIQIEAGRNTTMDFLSLVANGGTISGTVFIKGFEDLSGVLITAMDNSEGYSYVAATDKEGSYLFSNVHPGVYTLSFSKAGYDTITREGVSLVAGQSTTIDISAGEFIRSTGVVAGFVSLKGQTSAVGTMVEIKSISSITTMYSAIVGSNGMFEITGVEPGNYYLVANKDGFIPNQPVLVTVEKDKVSTVDSIVLVNERVTVKGSVVLDGSASHEGVAVLLSNKDSNGESPSTTTNERGEYTFRDVAPGTYSVIASKDGFAAETTDYFDVEASIDRTIDAVTLKVATRSITGRIELEEATDFSGALITATNTGDQSLVYSAISNGDGYFTLAGMDAGNYSLNISKTNYRTETISNVDVVAGSVPDIRVELKIARGTITGIARLEGCSDYSNIKVSIPGTKHETYTDGNGVYSFSVPSSNYPGGLRFEYEDFETTSHATTITVLIDSTNAVPDVELKCINVPRVTGRATVHGYIDGNYDGISVGIVELPSFSCKTDRNGYYSFEHVPVGTYTLEFIRENARKVTKIVSIEPSLSTRIEDIELIPDAVSLYGNISMEGVSDYSGVNVKVLTPDSVELKTVTNAAGYWYIGNVIASKSHTIAFEKEGWVSQSFEIPESQYEPLSSIDYNDTHPVVLKDTTPPVLTDVSATIGRSTENGREVILYLYTDEKGSGVKWIQGNTSESFDGVEEQSFYNPFTLLIPNELGEYTIYVKVKDAAGNESNTLNTNIVVKDDRNTLKGILSGDQLKLEKGTYSMEGDVLVEKGKTLVIQPGVEIQVKGAFCIQVEGTLEAVGKENDRIRIYGMDDGAGKWKGLNFVNDSSSSISYADISGMEVGVYGYCDLDHVLLNASNGGWSLGLSYDRYNNKPFYGDVSYSTIEGNANLNSGIVKDCEFHSSSLYMENVYVFRNNFSEFSQWVISGVLNNNTFTGSGKLSFENSVVVNNKFSGGPSLEIKNCTVRLTTFDNASLAPSGGCWERNDLYYCSFDSYSVNFMNESNLVGCGDITVSTPRSTRESYDMTGNFWGDDKLAALDAVTATKPEGGDLGFIHDYYDENNFNVSKVLYQDYKRTKIEDCGFMGEAYGTTGDYSGYSIGDTGPSGGFVFYDKGFYSDGWRYLEAAPKDLDYSLVFGYYRQKNTNQVVGTSWTIGSGLYNTQVLVEAMDMEGKAYSNDSGDATKEYAARKCLDYEYGGFDDWFLPSSYELNLMYKNLHNKGLGSFASSYYWSSSEYDGSYAWGQYFSSGNQDGIYRYNAYRVRPVRAF